MNILKKKVVEFLMLWVAYLIFFLVGTSAAVLVILPLVIFMKTGELSFSPPIGLLPVIARGVVAASLALAVVMFVWEHVRKRQN
jgi:hypothetical protein